RPVLVGGRVGLGGRVFPGHGGVLVVPRLRHVERVGRHRYLGLAARGRAELALVAGLSGVALALPRRARIVAGVLGHGIAPVGRDHVSRWEVGGRPLWRDTDRAPRMGGDHCHWCRYRSSRKSRRVSLTAADMAWSLMPS